MRFRFPVALVFLVLASASSSGQYAPLPDALDKVARAEIEKQGLVGTAVGVVVDGKVAYLRGYGLADRETRRDIEPGKTSFRWASCSKMVTAIAALQLADAGKLDLDADVRTYVPEFPDKGVKITARQLL